MNKNDCYSAPFLVLCRCKLNCLITFNMPFTLVKGLLDVVLCFLIYKPLSPLLHK